MTHRGHAADGKARDRTDLIDPGAGEGFACKGRGAVGGDLIAARGEEEGEPPAFCSGKEDGFYDLVQFDACRIRRLLGGAGFARHFEWRDVEPCGMEGGGDAGEAFAHAGLRDG